MSPGTQAGKKNITHIETTHNNQNHFDAVESINSTNNFQPTMMVVHEQGVVID